MNRKSKDLIVVSAVCACMSLGALSASGAEFFVSPVGSDSNRGTKSKPLHSLAGARDKVRASGKLGKDAVTVSFLPGTYYFDKTVVLSPEDSGTEAAPVVYSSLEEGKAVFSGGKDLDLKWESYRGGVMKAKTPKGLSLDQLFVNGERQHMARYPNFDPKVRYFNGFAADAFSKERAARWKDPAGGYIHAMHRAHWGGYHYLITGKDENGEVTYEGGWQNNRQSSMHKSQRFVENIFEELDAPGEWYHDSSAAVLYYYPSDNVDLSKAQVVASQLDRLVDVAGSKEKPVSWLTLEGITFRHTDRTFMQTKEPLLRSDWTIYRGGVVTLTGALNCTVSNCTFDSPGGNALFVNKWNRKITVKGSHFKEVGASGVAFVGSPDAVRNPKFEYKQKNNYRDIDKTPGPKSDDYPADCLVEDCLIERTGRIEKQGAGVQISMSHKITVRHCSIYDTSRSGINISEGTFGGHVIEFCDVFDTVKETGDHGSFNSWGRDRFWQLKGAPHSERAELAKLDMLDKNIIRNSRWRCDHGWDVDLDDGSSNYEIYNNLFLNGGLKMREGFHRKVYNNIAINNALHPHVWYPECGDEVTGNIWMRDYRHAFMKRDSQFSGAEVDRNMFISESDRIKYADKGWDLNSIVGDPMFVDPANGDFRVGTDSPFLKFGFKNFPMDQFGVQKPSLKAIARVPVFPTPKAPLGGHVQKAAKIQYWVGATVAALSGEEFSAFGVSKEDGGIHLIKVPAKSELAKAGLKDGDLVQKIDGKPVKTVAELDKQTRVSGGKSKQIVFVRGQKEMTLTLP